MSNPSTTGDFVGYRCTVNDCPGQHKHVSETCHSQVVIKEEPHMRCNFCGEHARDVFVLITGPSVNICNTCVVQSMDLVTKEITRRETKLNKVVSFNETEDNKE